MMSCGRRDGRLVVVTVQPVAPGHAVKPGTARAELFQWLPDGRRRLVEVLAAVRPMMLKGKIGYVATCNGWYGASLSPRCSVVALLLLRA
jgi:hypothetical protein